MLSGAGWDVLFLSRDSKVFHYVGRRPFLLRKHVLVSPPLPFQPPPTSPHLTGAGVTPPPPHPTGAGVTRPVPVQPPPTPLVLVSCSASFPDRIFVINIMNNFLFQSPPRLPAGSFLATFNCPLAKNCTGLQEAAYLQAV